MSTNLQVFTHSDQFSSVVIIMPNILDDEVLMCYLHCTTDYHT
jgi:hypothetical protein